MKTIRTFSEHVCPPETPLHSVLERLDRSSYVFQIVLDSEGRLVGTITDGDIRRAMLKRVDLDMPASQFMHPNPRYGLVGEDRENIDKLGLVGSTRRFLPVVDKARRLVEVLVPATQDAGISRALVMAGGFGRRLGERTRNTPKPLIEVGGRPMLDRLLGSLEDVGVRDVTLSIHYLGDQIRSFVGNRSNRARIGFVEENEPLGTAGALGLLDDSERSPILVVNGDVLTRCDFAALHDFHVRHDLDGTVGVARYDVDVPYGVVLHDDDGLFAGIEEKPRISKFVAAGVYYLASEFTALVPSGRPIDMPELLNSGREIGLRIGLFPIHEYWADVGHPDDLEAADARHWEEAD